MTFMGSLLRESREKQGLTQSDVADKLGFESAQYVSNVERGISSLSIKHAKPLARLLNITVDAIINAKTEDTRARFAQAVKGGSSKKRVSGL